ncbi:MAG: class I SAM-dependent methyltransferase [Desulfatibacillaceae bacterium]
MDDSTDTSRISPTAHYTGYVWVRNGLSDKNMATLHGRAFYTALRPGMWAGRVLLGISDVETVLLQRHLMIDHLLEKAVEEKGVGQILELAVGLSPRGFRLARRFAGTGMRYVEADLPSMALRKRRALVRQGLMGKDHRVVECNILEPTGPRSLSGIAKTHLRPGVPTAVVTEGLINYFPTSDMAGMWSDIAGVLENQGGGVYLTDAFLHRRTHLMYPVVLGWIKFLEVFARGRIHLHFDSNEQAVERMKRLGFDEARVHAPESFANVLDIPFTRLRSLASVIEAEVEPGRG